MTPLWYKLLWRAFSDQLLRRLFEVWASSWGSPASDPVSAFLITPWNMRHPIVYIFLIYPKQQIIWNYSLDRTEFASGIIKIYAHFLSFLDSERVQAPVPLSIFRSNSKFDENSKHSSVQYTRPITTIFCTRHDSVTVVTCAKYRCDRSSILETRAFWIFIECRIRSKYA